MWERQYLRDARWFQIYLPVKARFLEHPIRFPHDTTTVFLHFPSGTTWLRRQNGFTDTRNRLTPLLSTIDLICLLASTTCVRSIKIDLGKTLAQPHLWHFASTLRRCVYHLIWFCPMRICTCVCTLDRSTLRPTWFPSDLIEVSKGRPLASALPWGTIRSLVLDFKIRLVH